MDDVLSQHSIDATVLSSDSCKGLGISKSIVKNLRLTILLLISIPMARAADPVHLLGFVERLCEDQPMCFEFRTEKVYSGEAKEFSRVYYDKNSRIYDPENYEVTPAQSNIVRGSHLRIMMVPVSDGFFANYIWVGD